jgi:hypothetical protein
MTLQNHFKTLGIHKSFHIASQYLYVGIANHCDAFLDWSLLKFVAEYFNHVDVLSFCAQILCYFPEESRLLNHYFYQPISQPKLSLCHRFLLYQIHQVNCLRQFSAPNKIAQNLIELHALAQNGILTARKFWANPDVKISYFYNLKVYTDNVISYYNESIKK